MSKTRGGFKQTMSEDLKPPGGGSSWRPLPRTQAAVKKHQIPEDCLHCGASVLSYGHFLHKAEVYCEGAEGLGKTLGLWLSDRKVAKATRWRLEKTFENMKNGNVPGPNTKTCKKCGQIMKRETGHSVLSSARESFCQRSDPKGRTVDQWLTEKRGGITSSEMAQRATKLANERQRRYRRMQAKKAERAQVDRDTLALRKRDDKKDEEKQENKDVPDGVSCKGESSDGLQLQDHLHIKKEEEELWESVEVKQETDITAVTVKSEDEEEEAQCSLLHWRQSEENIKGEPATCSSAKVMKVEPNGDISESPERPYGCDLCEKRFNSKAYLKVHMRIHTGEKPFGCDVCGKQFSNKARLKIHLRIHTGEKPYGCDVCSQKFNRKSTLSKHIRIHTGEKPYGCDVCNQKFNCKSNLSKHMRIHTGEKPFDCDVCDKGFFHKSELNQHMRIHTGEKPYCCDACDKRFYRKSILNQHMSIHTGEKPYGCDVCSQKFNQKSNLSKHMRIHTGEKPYGCDVCSQKFNRKSNLSKHMRIHTGVIPYGCDVCSQKFNRKSNLSKHMSTHTGEKPYGCDVCNQKFTRKSNLSKHMRIHTGEKPFGCDVCDKIFHRKSILNQHMSTHTGEKAYSCDVCIRKFNQKSNLFKHMRIHTGEKPYGCDVCSQKFNQKSNLSKHMRIHTGRKPNGCDEKLWESLEEKQETDITAVTVKSEDEEEEAQCSLLHWRQSEESIKGEPATCSSAKVMKVEPNGDISEGPEAANTCTQPDTDGEETDCSDTENSEDWREPLSQSEAQSEHMDMSCDSFHTSENNTQVVTCVRNDSGKDKI